MLTALIEHQFDAGNNPSAVGTADLVPAEFIPLKYPMGICFAEISPYNLSLKILNEIYSAKISQRDKFR